MIREPKIPMSPEDLPQQRIHEVVALPGVFKTVSEDDRVGAVKGSV